MTYKPFEFQDVAGPARDMVGYGRHVPRVRWPNNARVAISLVLNYEEGSEYSHPAGDGRNDGLIEVIYTMDPAYRNPAAEAVLEYGSPADFLDNLKRGFDLLWEEGETHPRMMSIGLRPSGPILTLGSQALGESAHQNKASGANRTDASV